MPISRGTAADYGFLADAPGEPCFSWQGAPAGRVYKPRIVAVGAADARRAKLAQTIEADIIPRLMMAHQTNAAAAEIAAAVVFAPPHDLAEFVELVATREAAVATSYVGRLLDKGMSVESAYLDLLAPAARRFGEQWDLDLVDFTEVGLGLTRLHQVMTAIGERAPTKTAPRNARRRALLVSMSDEKHNFGLFMVSSFFRRANWDVFGWPLMTDQELVELVRSAPFDVIGISVSSAETLDRAQSAIALIRGASRHRAVKIMVGGPHFCAHPEAAAAIGADATSSDGLRAVETANNLVKLAAMASWS